MHDGRMNAAGGGYPPGGGAPPGGWGPPGGGAPPGGWGPPGGPPPGGGWGPPGPTAPGTPPAGQPAPFAPAPGWGPAPGAPPAQPGWGPAPPPNQPQPPAPVPQGPGGGYTPPGVPGGGHPPAAPGGGYGPPAAPPPGIYGPAGVPPGGGYGPSGGGGHGPPGGGGGYVPPGGGGYAPPGGGYAPPGGAGYPPSGGYGAPGGFGGGYGPPPGAAGEWSPIEAYSHAAALLQKDFAAVALPIAAAFVVASVPGWLISFVGALLVAFLSSQVDPNLGMLLGGLLRACTGAVSFGLQAFIMAGVTDFALRSLRGEKPEFNVVFSGGKNFVPFLVAGIVNGLLVAIGMLLCLAPGVIVALGFMLYAPLIVDEQLNGIDTLKRSWEMTKGHRLNLLGFAILAFCVSIAGILACGIGLVLVSMPIVILAQNYIYLRIKGERPAQLA